MPEDFLVTDVVQQAQGDYNKPLVICAGAGLAGIASAEYIIEKLGLHQVGYVRSQHIPPVAVYIGEKLRRPFRIYADDTRRLVVAICEVPLETAGLYEISSALMGWIEKTGAREIVVLDSVPVRGIPKKREVFFMAEEGRGENLRRFARPATSALVGGLGGSLLMESIGRKVAGVALLVPTSVAIPDPGAALAIVKAVNSVYGLKVSTEELEKNVERMNSYLKTLAEQHKKLQPKSVRKAPESMYG